MHLAKNSKLLHNILLKSVNATKFDELASEGLPGSPQIAKLPAFYRGCTLQPEYTMLGWCPCRELTSVNAWGDTSEEIPGPRCSASPSFLCHGSHWDVHWLEQAVIFLNSNNQGPLWGSYFPPPLFVILIDLWSHNEWNPKEKQALTLPPSPLCPQIHNMPLVHLAFSDYVKKYHMYTALLFHENFKLLFLGSTQPLPHSVIKRLESTVLE